ncbi:MAG: AMP-binding protein [Acidimicrobiia bacterium]
MTDGKTIAELLRARAGDDRTGLCFEDRRWSWREVVAESAQRAAWLWSEREPGPLHVGVLLENVPEYLFWLGAAALTGGTIVGINPTRRGAELRRDIAHTDCQLIVSDHDGLDTLAGLDLELDRSRFLAVDDPAYGDRLDAFRGAPAPDVAVDGSALFLLIFTSGTTGAPKAVQCSQGRLAGIAEVMTNGYGITTDDVLYSAMPLFHGNALMTNWSPALRCGASVALRRKFSAGGFLPDIRRYGATYFNYVGKCLTYILATPEQPDDADNRLQRVFGNEASDRDIARFQRRFGCSVVEGYGSSEGGAAINKAPGTPPGALGAGRDDGIVIVNPDTLEECPRADFDDTGRLTNAHVAIGEIVNKNGVKTFEGYYKNDEANEVRTRNGWFWSGDLGYRDAEGYFYFAGRDADWLRVDGENFAAAPVERILMRFPGVVMAGVYAVPDALAGDQVMCALELEPGMEFDAAAFGPFLQSQSDLGTKWAPRYVRIASEMPLTGTHKLVKQAFRHDRWECSEPVFWRDGTELVYRPMNDGDRATVRAEFDRHGRSAVLDLM